MSTGSEPLQPASADSLETMNKLIYVSIFTFAITSTYRIIHCSFILYKVLSSKIYEWFSFVVPIFIILWSIAAISFAIYLWDLEHSVSWTQIDLQVLFACIFGLSSYFKWF